MAPEFQSSFIPKEPVATKEVFEKKKAGIFGILAVSLFISSIVIAGALYFYKGILENDIRNLEQQLADSEKSIDRETINELVAFSQKLKAAKTVVSKHQVLSKTLEAISSSTVSSVQYNSFSYNSLEKGSLSISMKGKAAGYSSIALQENILSENKYFKSISFSSLSLENNGMVSFDLKVEVDPKIANYLSN